MIITDFPDMPNAEPGPRHSPGQLAYMRAERIKARWRWRKIRYEHAKMMVTFAKRLRNTPATAK